MHIPVLLKETLELLDIQYDDTVLDATLGGGGHAEAISKRLGKRGLLVGLDQDGEALVRAEERLGKAVCKHVFVKSNFSDLGAVLNDLGIRQVDKVLFDLGLSSDQLTPDSGQAGRGFSFMRDEPLLMTLDDKPDDSALNAASIVNSWDHAELERIFREHGEEKNSASIAKLIVENRRKQRIVSSKDLADIIEAFANRGSRDKHHRMHPATKIFQALRIAVNDEFGVLERGLEQGWERLKIGGRIAVISFHSLEDRIVKKFIVDLAKSGLANSLTRKPIIPDLEEVRANPRSRSAKLRVVRKNA